MSVTIVTPAKTDEPTEMPSGVWTQASSRKHALDGSPDPPTERGQF